MLDDKIEWMEWEKESFKKAKRDNKPILLDIFGVWCHWCHVADKTTYADKDVIKIVNENFIPVKVDTDKRPDINQRYNQGGWPTTAFLTSKGRLIGGGTYFQPQEFKLLLFRVSEFYKKNRLKIDTCLLYTSPSPRD